MASIKSFKLDHDRLTIVQSVSRSGKSSFFSLNTISGRIFIGALGFITIVCLGVGIGVILIISSRGPTTTTTTSTTSVTTTTTTSTTSDTTTTTSDTTSTTTTTTTTLTTVTFIPVGIWALNIPTCATWNQTGVTVAGNPNGTLGSDLRSLRAPVSIFVDNNSTLYICDRDNHRIIKYEYNALIGTVVAGGQGSGNNATQLNGPKGVAVDQYGDIIVADSVNYRIQKFSGGSMTGVTLAINSSVNRLGHTRDLQIDVNNNVYVTDSDNSQVLKFIPGNGIGVVLVGSSGAGSASNQLRTPYGTTMNINQSLFIADNGNHRIQRWDLSATTGVTVAGVSGSSGTSTNNLNGPISVIVDNNDYIYIADGSNHRIMRWSPNYSAGGTCIIGCSRVAGNGMSQLRSPRDLKFDRYGNIYVSDQGNHRIQKFDIDVVTGCSGWQVKQLSRKKT